MSDKTQLQDGDALVHDLLSEDADFQAGYAQGQDIFEAISLLHSFLERSGKSRSEVAAAMGVSPARITQALRGTGRDGPSYAFIKRFARACGIAWPQAADDVTAKAEPQDKPTFERLLDVTVGGSSETYWPEVVTKHWQPRAARAMKQWSEATRGKRHEPVRRVVKHHLGHELEGRELYCLVGSSGRIVGEFANVRTETGRKSTPVLILPLEDMRLTSSED